MALNCTTIRPPPGTSQTPTTARSRSNRAGFVLAGPLTVAGRQGAVDEVNLCMSKLVGAGLFELSREIFGRLLSYYGHNPRH